MLRIWTRRSSGSLCIGKSYNIREHSTKRAVSQRVLLQLQGSLSCNDRDYRPITTQIRILWESRHCPHQVAIIKAPASSHWLEPILCPRSSMDEHRPAKSLDVGSSPIGGTHERPESRSLMKGSVRVPLGPRLPHRMGRSPRSPRSQSLPPEWRSRWCRMDAPGPGVPLALAYLLPPPNLRGRGTLRLPRLPTPRQYFISGPSEIISLDYRDPLLHY